MHKKILSILLALTMVLAIAPMSVFAEDDIIDHFAYAIADNSITITGCDLFFSGDVVLPDTIEGYPVTKIDRYAFNNCKEITSITINNNITEIDYMAFYGCSGLISVTIGNSVTHIGDSAFESCTGLTNVTIPDSVKTIGYRAFYGCTGLTNITIGSSVTSIGTHAFSGCSELTSIEIPASVTSILSPVFEDCIKLTGIIVDENNEYYSSDEYGVLFGKFLGLDKKELIKYPTGSNKTAYSIPNSVAGIDYRAFDNCTNLTSIAIPDSVTTIDDQAFTGCTALASITVDENNAYYSSDENGVLYGVPDSDKNAIFRSEKTELKKYPTGNSRTEYTIPDTIKSIGSYAFSDCTNLTSVTISNSVTRIGWFAFYNCTELSNISIANSVSTIDRNAFSNCSGLTNITIPDSVTIIGDYAFSGCSGLTNITIPDSVEMIGCEAFRDCSGLISVTIGKNVTEMLFIEFYDKSTFFGCTNLTSITVDENNKYYASDEFGVLFNKDKTELIQYPSGNKRTEYFVPDSVIEIGWYSFVDCPSLTNITIGNNVTEIGVWAFNGCAGLTNLIIPDSVTIILWGAFSDCTELTNVTIDGSVILIDNAAFENCTSLTKILIPENVITINDYAFGYVFDDESGYPNKVDDFTIYGYTGSVAETYARRGNMTFIKLCKEHLSTVTKDNSDATCVNNGYTGNIYCNDCDELLIEGEIIPMLGHTEKVIPEVAPTFTETGLTEGKKCSVCGEILVEQIEIPMLINPDLTTNNEAITVVENSVALKPEMSVSAFIESVENESVVVFSADGTQLTNDALVGTGSKVQILDNDGKVLSEYEVMVKSDVDGNGKITPADARLALRASANLDKLEGVFETAANYDGQDTISTSDARMILRKAAGLE